MTQKQFNVRGIDPLLYEQVIQIVKSKYGGRRGKHSNVAREINEMFRVYIEAEGENVAHTHTSKTEAFRNDLEKTVKKYGCTEKVVREVMYSHGLTDDRTLLKWMAYAERYFDDVLKQDNADRVERRKALPGYN